VQQSKSRRFNSVADKRWDMVRSASHFNSSCWLNALKDMTSIVSRLNDVSQLKVAVKGAIVLVAERLQEMVRCLESHRKIQASYESLCLHVEDTMASMADDDAAAVNETNNGGPSQQSKALQGSLSDLHRTEKAYSTLTKECNQALMSLKGSAKGWLLEVSEIEGKRLLLTRETLASTLSVLEKMSQRRAEICNKSRESFRLLEESQAEEEDTFEKANETMVDDTPLLLHNTEHDTAATVEMLQHRAARAVEWVDERHKHASRAHWLLTGVSQDERVYVNAVDWACKSYGFLSSSDTALPGTADATTATTATTARVERRQSGVGLSLFTKLKE
jgi:hypothetical protein